MAADDSRWKQHKRALDEAVAARDWPRAELSLAAMWTEAKARGEALFLCNTHFSEGVLRDKQGRLEEAEGAFTQALALDEAAHGKHGAPDTLHSLGLVRERRGNFEGALESYRAAAGLLRASQPFAFARAVSPVVQLLWKLGRLDEALALLDEADGICDAQALTPEPDEARLSLLRGETLRRLQSSEAIVELGVATTYARASMPLELAEVVGAAWFSLHRLAKDDVLSALACWYASQLGHAELRKRAAEVLATLPGRRHCLGDPTQPRIALKRPAFVFVASTTLGLVQARVTTGAEPGDAVDLERSDDDRITAVTRAPG